MNGETVVLDATGALYWPSEQTLVLADLHFEKGSWFARGGVMLPPYDTHATLGRIARLLKAYKPVRVVALGDSFHDVEGPWRLDPGSREMLQRCAAVTEWIWIAGNHDPQIPRWLGGRTCTEIAIGNLLFRHEPWNDRVVGEVAGHLHPCATIARYGRSLRRRCFVTDGYRMVLPSFGAYTGGLDVRDEAFAPLFGTGYLAYALGGRRVYAVAGKGQALLRRKMSEDSQPSSPAMSTVERP